MAVRIYNVFGYLSLVSFKGAIPKPIFYIDRTDFGANEAVSALTITCLIVLSIGSEPNSMYHLSLHRVRA